jgi:subtilisin family serine protease
MKTFGTMIALLGLIASFACPDVNGAEPLGEKYWFFFRDKGPADSVNPGMVAANARVSAKSIQRRLKASPSSMPVDWTDVELYGPYIQSLRRLGIFIEHRSRWFNAVSGWATGEQLAAADQLNCIVRVRPVAAHTKPSPPQTLERHLKKSLVPQTGSLDYGPSYLQNALIHVPQLHDLGYTGSGVLVAVLDDGFQLDHTALQHIDVVAQYDFINRDSIVAYQQGQDALRQGYHGTQVLATLAGYQPGELIGPAYDATFLLAKTEQWGTEMPVEEDYWVAAAEWAERNGADVLTSSLGYFDWYTYDDLDGNTALVTKAADLAVKKGMVVLTSAGNWRRIPWHYIAPPADGDSVLAVGAVDKRGVIAYFSSVGPTVDGRIKPEVCAMGISVTTVSATDPGGYVNLDGTSFACPQIAGVAALLLSAQPELTPMDLRDALLSTADRAVSPDTLYGYGVVNAYAALNWLQQPLTRPEDNLLVGVFPNPVTFPSQDVTFRFDLFNRTRVQVDIYDILGRHVATVWDAWMGAYAGQSVRWDGRNENGQRVPSGLYVARIDLNNKVEWSHVTVIR